MNEMALELAWIWQTVVEFFAFDTARLTEPDMILRLALQALLFVCSAFFSASETALFSLSRLDLQKLRRDRHRRSGLVHDLLDQPRRLIISILCGNEIAIIAATVNLAGILYSLYDAERAGWINIMVMSPLLLLFSEVTPKTIAIGNPIGIGAGLVAAPLGIWVRVVAPLRWAVRLVADRITMWIVGEERARENILQVDEFRTLMDEVVAGGELDAVERVLIDNLLEASEIEVAEIMTPRTQVKFLSTDMSVPEMVEKFRQYRHPRVPVFRDDRDNLVGFVHAEDIIGLILDNADLTTLKPADIMRPPIVVPATKNANDLFDYFQAHNARAAAVLNEFGGVDGFITMRDVLNFIFGGISESVPGQELYEERDKNVYEVPGGMKLTNFNDLTNFGIEDQRMTTIGGVVFRYLDRLPRVGDRVVIEGVVATVLEMDGHRIARLRVARGLAHEKQKKSATKKENIVGESDDKE